MDGVLIDSGDLHFQTWRDTLAAETGVTITRAQFEDAFGKDNFQTLGILLGRTPTPQQVDHLAGRKEQMFRELAAGHIQPQPGVVDLMRALSAAGWQQAVGTSAPRENVALVIAELGIERWLATWVCIDDVTRGKPDPALFWLAAERMDIPPACCVVIEDSLSGIAAARAAGMACLAVTTTYPASELTAADRVVDTLAAVTPGDMDALLAT